MLRRLRQDFLDVLGEPPLEHLVGLVQDHRPQARQRQRAASEVIHGSARRGHHDVDPVLQRLPLPSDRGAPVHGQNARSKLATVLGHRLADLEREFPGRYQDEGDRILGPASLAQQLQDWESERRRLPGAGRCSADDIDPGEHRGDGCRLDRRRLFITQEGERVVQLGPQVEIFEAARFGCWGDVHEQRPFRWMDIIDAKRPA